MGKMKIDFDGFDKMMEDIHKMNGDIKGATERALIKSRDFVNEGLREAMQKHIRTGETLKSLKNGDVEWDDSTAKIPLGFDLNANGHLNLASIYLMYGTKVYGTPRVKKDTKLWGAICGKSTKEKINDIMQKELQKVLDRET